MKQYTFETSNRSRWEDFAAQLDRLESSAGKMQYKVTTSDTGGNSARDFTTHYSRLSRDLSMARSRGYSQRLVDELNSLVGRGHNLLYTRRSGFLSPVLSFLFAGFPRVIRREWIFVAIATATFLLPALGIGYAIDQEPELMYSVMQPDEVYSMETMYDPGAEHFGRERGSGSDFAMFGFYIRHNIGISFQVFSTGILACLGSLVYLVFNGVVLGAVTVHLVNMGYGTPFLSFVIGHGSFELSAIVLSGAAGLKLGYALINPGLLPRALALKRAAAAAVPIVSGVAVMLVIAAFLEAFWSSTRFVPAEVKYLVGTGLWLGVFAYFLLAGRGTDGT